MDAVEFLKERKRLCLTFDCCDDCPLATDIGTCSFEKRHELNESEVVAQAECAGKCYDCRHNYWLTEIE